MSLPSDTTLGPFRVDPQGFISPATPATFPRFAVLWRQRAVHARMRQSDAADATAGTLDLTARVGRVPSTAGRGGTDAGRKATLRLLDLLPSLMPAQWTLRLTPDHSVLVEANARLVLPISVTSLVTELSMFLLTLTPYLDALDAEGIDFGAGTAKT